MPGLALDPARSLPADGTAGCLVGRLMRPGLGASVVAVRSDGVYDVTSAFPTTADLFDRPDPAAALRAVAGERVGTFAEILANSVADAADPAQPAFLSPIDLQAVKAAGVTFALSMVERVIEEQAKGSRNGPAPSAPRSARSSAAS